VAIFEERSVAVYRFLNLPPDAIIDGAWRKDLDVIDGLLQAFDALYGVFRV
jgi:hypothetical protein